MPDRPGPVTPTDRATLEADGYVALPAFAEPHAHLDKAFLAERVPNPSGDLLGAIEAMHAARGSITLADTVERAERAARLMLANGTTAIRTHVDIVAGNGLTPVEALVEVRARLAGLVEIQIVALTGRPSLGPEGDEVRGLLADALAAGADFVGGCPHLEPDVGAANEQFLAIAADHGVGVDLHTDETLNRNARGLADLAERVIRSGFPYGVTASHCVSLGMQSELEQRATAARVAEAGIGVIALPQTNLYLQGRDGSRAVPRGLTAVAALRAAGVRVAAGADNLQDPFNPLGRGDPLEIAGMMVLAAHLSPEDAVRSVSCEARSVMGLAPTGDVVGIRAATIREAIAFTPPGRVLLRSSVTVDGPDTR